MALFSKRKKSWKANQKRCNERAGTRLGRDSNPVSKGSHIMVSGVTLLGLHRTNLSFRGLVFANTMRNDSEFEQKYESGDSEYHFIPGYKIEVDERR